MQLEGTTTTQHYLDKFKGKFTDDYLFEIEDMSRPEDERLPVLMPGNMVEGKIMNGHYKVDYVGLNENSTAKKKEKRNEAIKQRVAAERKKYIQEHKEQVQELKEPPAKKGAKKDE